MKNLGDKQRWCLGGWVIAAALLVWFNGWGYLSIENQPLESESPTLRSLKEKLSRLESALSTKAGQSHERMDKQLLFAAYRRTEPQNTVNGLPYNDNGLSETDNGLSDTDKGVPVTDGNVAARDKPEQVDLPILTGILQVADPTRTTVFLAVLDGRVCRERDRVQAFTVGKISAQGVTVQRQNDRYFIASPTPYFSSDQGR